jgi:hypothetical protein
LAPKTAEYSRMSILAVVSQPNPVLFLGIFFGGFILLTAIPTFFISRNGKKTLQAVADRLGFTIAPKFQVSSTNRSGGSIFGFGGSRGERGIEGTVRGRAVQISEFLVDEGKHEQTYLELVVAANANHFKFALHRRGLIRKLGGFLGVHETTIGDEEFDRRWRITASDMTTLQSVLSPELRTKIDQSANNFSEFNLYNDWIRYREQATISNSGPLRRMEGMVELMCDLAEAIEKVAEKSKEA